MESWLASHTYFITTVSGRWGLYLTKLWACNGYIEANSVFPFTERMGMQRAGQLKALPAYHFALAHTRIEVWCV